MVKQNRRSGKGRRSDIDRRKISESNYKGPERRSRKDRRSEKDRRRK